MRKEKIMRFFLAAVLAISMLAMPLTTAYAESVSSSSDAAPSSAVSSSTGTESSPDASSSSGAASSPDVSSSSGAASSPDVSSSSGAASSSGASSSSETVSSDVSSSSGSADTASAATAADTVNLAQGKGNDAFTLEMEGAGTDLDPATKDTTIREKEESILNRLTDGYYGSGEILDGNWNGSGMRSHYYEAYRQIDRAITLDLGQLSHIESLSFHMQEGLGWGISAPSMVTYFLSEDGVTFHRVGRVSRFDAVKDEDPDHYYSVVENGKEVNCQSYYFTLDGLNYNARYVKVAFELTGTWAFADELEVRGTAAPSDTAETLPDTPGTDYEVVNKYAWTDQARGIQHEALAYAGHWFSSAGGALQTSQKTVEELLPMVGYVDEEGNITDKFFESVTFLSHGYTPNLDTPDDDTDYHNLIYVSSTMTSNPNAAQMCATAEDWQTYLDFLFHYGEGTGTAYNLDALNEAVALVKEATGDADYKVGVKIAFYPPILCQDAFGTLPGGTHSLNFAVSDTNPAQQALADRMEASRWYLDTVIREFKAKGYENLRLDGFYWYDEVMHYDVDPLVLETVQGVTDYVHSLENGAYQIYWIPFYQSSGFRAWKTFGFDYAIMQPNYAFDANASEQRIADTAALCKKYGLGIEMEFGGINDKYISQFRSYLTQGADDKLPYQNNSLIAWYTGTWGIAETSQNVSGTRYIYDAMHDFFSGIPTEMEKPVKNLAAAGTLTLEAENVKNTEEFNKLLQALPKLVDGNEKAGAWNDSYVKINANHAQGPFTLTADLGGIGQVERVALGSVSNPGWGIGAPDSVSYSVSQDGQTWKELGTVTYAQAEISPGAANGFETVEYVLKLDAAEKARYIRAEFGHGLDASKDPAAPYTWLGVDEFTVNGTAPLASGEGIASMGTITLESGNVLNSESFANLQNVASVLLNNGVLQTGSWANQNTLNGDYIGVLQTVATEPFTLQISFDTVAEVQALGVDYLAWVSAGIGAPDKVTYSASLDGKSWTELGTVAQEDARRYEAIATGMDAYHFVLETGAPVRVKYLKAEFERGFNTDKNTKFGWVAFDEFTVEGALTSEQPAPVFNEVDSATGIRVAAGLDTVPAGAHLKVKPVDAGDAAYASVARAFRNENVDLAAFDISLLLDGGTVQPRGVLNVAFPLPQGFDAAKTQLYHVSPEGEKELLTAKTADGLLNAELTHLSLYVLAQPKAGAESGGSSSSAPSGGTSSSSADTSSSSGTPSGGAGGASSGTAAPAPGMPRTGDAFPLVWVTVAAAACVVLLAVLAWKKHRETRA